MLTTSDSDGEIKRDACGRVGLSAREHAKDELLAVVR